MRTDRLKLQAAAKLTFEASTWNRAEQIGAYATITLMLRDISRSVENDHKFADGIQSRVLMLESFISSFLGVFDEGGHTGATTERQELIRSIFAETDSLL